MAGKQRQRFKLPRFSRKAKTFNVFYAHKSERKAIGVVYFLYNYVAIFIVIFKMKSAINNRAKTFN